MKYETWQLLTETDIYTDSHSKTEQTKLEKIIETADPISPHCTSVAPQRPYRLPSLRSAPRYAGHRPKNTFETHSPYTNLAPTYLCAYLAAAENQTVSISSHNRSTISRRTPNRTKG
jgi:hypothetical protein